MYMYAILCCTEFIVSAEAGYWRQKTPPLVNEPSVQGADQPVNCEFWLRPCHQLMQIVGRMMPR